MPVSASTWGKPIIKLYIKWFGINQKSRNSRAALHPIEMQDLLWKATEEITLDADKALGLCVDCLQDLASAW